MIDFILLSVIISLVVLIAYKEKINKEEKDKLINALVAKNATELRDLTAVDKIVVKPTVPEKPDLVSMDSLSDEEWNNQVLKT